MAMLRESAGEGPTVEEAIDAALAELGVQQDAVEFEILEEPARKILGLGVDRGARVRVWLKEEFVNQIEDARRIAHEELENGDRSAVETKATSDPIAPDSTVSLTDDELDNVADAASDTVNVILDSFGIDAEVEEYEGDEGEIILDVVGGDLAVLIGRHGRTLDSIQVLTSAITNKRLGFRHPVIIDVEGYRNRRKTKLEEIGLRAAARAARQGSAVKLRPMSALERRVIHMALRDDLNVQTASEGDDPYRAVVVSPRRR